MSFGARGADFETAFFGVSDFNQPRMFLILFSTLLALQLLRRFREQLQYFRSGPDAVYGAPPKLLGLISAPALNDRQFLIAGLVLIGSLLAAAAGVATRAFLLLALISHFLYFNPITSLAYVQRKVYLSSIVLLILLFSPGVDQPLAQPTTNWPVVLVRIALAQMYFSAAVQKLRASGWQWADGRNLQAYLVNQYLWSDLKWAMRLAHFPRACRALSIGLVGFEMSFLLILFFPSLSLPYALAGLAFHAGTSVVMRIEYLKYLGPVYSVFFTDAAFACWQFVKDQ